MRTDPVGSVSDHRAENGTTKYQSPFAEVGVTAFRETCAASCGDTFKQESRNGSILPKRWHFHNSPTNLGECAYFYDAYCQASYHRE